VVKPLVTFADAEAAMHAYLVSAYGSRVEAYKPDTFSTAFPKTPLTQSPLLIHLQIEREAGNLDDFPVVGRQQVRFTTYAHHAERTNVKASASLTLALVLAHPGSSTIAGTRPQAGLSDVITDPDTKNLMVWFTAWVDVKATQLAS
jgi:hypothetical protein